MNFICNMHIKLYTCTAVLLLLLLVVIQRVELVFGVWANKKRQEHQCALGKCRWYKWVNNLYTVCQIFSRLLSSSRNSSTKDLTQFAAEAIAFNRQLSQHDEHQEDVGAIVCSMRLSPPSNSRLARRRAQSNALRTGDFAPSSDDLAAWSTSTGPLAVISDWF